jgi:hypothetical protein
MIYLYIYKWANCKRFKENRLGFRFPSGNIYLHFCLQQTNGNCCFPFSKYVYIYCAYFKWKYIYIYAAVSNGKWKQKPRRFSLIRLPVAHRANYSLWRAVDTPGDRQTSRVYCTTLIQYLYISCYLFSNKLVLWYLLLRLLPQW